MYVDIAFELLFPIDAELSGLNWKQPFFEWQGQRFPQGSEETSFSYFKLIKSDVPAHIIKFLPENFKKERWQCISINEGLEKVKEDFLKVEKNNDENDLFNLLIKLIGVKKKWVLIFELEYDTIDDVGEGDINVVFQKIRNSLTVDRKGFIIWNKDS